MAFPSAERKSEDKEFLKPFNPDDFPELRKNACEKKTEENKETLEQVHAPRGPDTGFLFRIDPQPGGTAVILVQSALEPDWDYAFQNVGYLLAARSQAKPFEPCFGKGERVRFRLLANPTRKIDTKSGPDGKRRNGRRVPVRDEELLDWLVRRAQPWGTIDQDNMVAQPGYVYVNKERNGQGQRLRAVRYDGVFTVGDPDKLQAAIARGVGPGKAFGFGLLSVGAVR